MQKLLDIQPDAVEITAQALLNGGVAAVPTETVYGLMCLYDAEAPRERIYHLKHRPASKQLQMLAPSLEVALEHGVLDTPELRKLATHFWPGALTLVVPNKDCTDSIGLRIPDHPFVLKLLQRCGTVLAATSANRSGSPAPVNIVDALSGLDGEPDVAVDGGVITATAGRASTVVSLLNSAPALIREGVITLAQLKMALL